MPARRLGVTRLEPFWSRHGAGQTDVAEWVRDNTLLAGLRLGLRETFDYLLQTRPSLEAFESWILEKNGGTIDPKRIERLNAALSDGCVASQPAGPWRRTRSQQADDLAFWNKNGYVVCHAAVPAAQCRAAVLAICDFLNVDLDRPETWYGGVQGHSIWIPLLHHPALQANLEWEETGRPV